jgi:hypothetical protein
MAWYLVKNGSRFHFSHSFKPLLLSQFESWYHGTAFSHRIRYNERKKRNDNNNNSNVESNVNVWLDSSVNNYIFRPTLPNSIFDGICLWEYESKYDLQLKKAHFLQESNDVDGHQGCIFQFHDQHPGYQYSILQQREDECIPQLYYSNKFPDIEVLEIEQGDNVDESVKQLREDYALKAMLLFFPFREKEDLTRNYSSLWESFFF